MTVGMVDCALCALSKNAAEQVAQELAAAKAEAGASLASLVPCVLRKKRSAYLHISDAPVVHGFGTTGWMLLVLLLCLMGVVRPASSTWLADAAPTAVRSQGFLKCPIIIKCGCIILQMEILIVLRILGAITMIE